MSDSNMSAFFDGLARSMKQQRSRQNTDDIIAFIKDHWRFFVSDKRDMISAVEMLGDVMPYSVNALCDQLGVPRDVFFKKSPSTDVAPVFVSFEKSKLKEAFDECCERTGNGIACLFIVAGKKSLCITNMQTTIQPGSFVSYYKPADDAMEIHIFNAEDAPFR